MLPGTKSDGRGTQLEYPQKKKTPLTFIKFRLKEHRHSDTIQTKSATSIAARVLRRPV